MESLISSFDPLLNKQKKGLLIFDIDSTIFNVSPRNQEIFDLFSSINKKKHPLLHELSSGIRLSPYDWGIHPYIIDGKMERPELKSIAMPFWKKHFFSGTFLHSDKPYPFVVEIIQFFHQLGAEILYLTGRDKERMRESTILQLKHWGLPLDKNSDLITKPNKEHLDQTYKKNEILKIIKKNSDKLIYFFDNEPLVFQNCIFPEHKNYYPIFIESTHSGRAEVKNTWTKLKFENYKNFLTSIKNKAVR